MRSLKRGNGKRKNERNRSGKSSEKFKKIIKFFLFNFFSTTDNSKRFSEMNLASHLEYFK